MEPEGTEPVSADPPRPSDPAADLVSALEVIEAQPLHTRAAAYEALNDALSRRLDAGPPAPRP